MNKQLTKKREGEETHQYLHVLQQSMIIPKNKQFRKLKTERKLPGSIKYRDSEK